MIIVNIKIILSFFIGGAVGATIATKIASDRYEKIMQEETTAMREYVSSLDSDEMVMPDGAKELAAKNKNKPTITNYNQMMKNTGYASSDENTTPEEPVPEYYPDVYVIDVNSFAEIDGYSLVELTYYDDGVLVDEDDAIIPLERIGGEESLSHFSEDGSLYVRNNPLMVDYEIDKVDEVYGKSN